MANDGREIPEGIAPNCTICVCQVSRENKHNDTVKVLKKLLKCKKNPRKESDEIDIVCMPFTLSTHNSDLNSEMQQCLRDLKEQNVICVALAESHTIFSDSDVLLVDALTAHGQVSEWNPEKRVQIYVPAESLVVPMIHSENESMPYTPPDKTSLAAPMVAGFLALLLECVKKSPSFSATESREIFDKFHKISFLEKILKHEVEKNFGTTVHLPGTAVCDFFETFVRENKKESRYPDLLVEKWWDK